MPIEFRPLESFGAEVVGLDLTAPVADSIQAEVRAAWLEHGVLLFRGIGVSTEVQVELSKWFGELLNNEDNYALKSLSVAGSKELIEVSRGGTPTSPSYFIDGKLKAGYLFWHQDLVYTPSICKGSLLRMVKMCDEGGETGWIDTAKVYDALSQEMKARIEGMEVRHRLRVNLRGVPFGLPESLREATQEEAPYTQTSVPLLSDVVHPLVQTHPETGRKSLGISPLGLVEILGLSPEESDALLRELVAFTLQPRFMFVHAWDENDMVVWDNRRTIHSVFGYPYGQQRIAQRATLAGEVTSGRYYEEALNA
ncbi:Alpha-ketoglutarate-dependent taurine dioxygenase [compost metagenome]